MTKATGPGYSKAGREAQSPSADEPLRGLYRQPSFAIWALHWISAILMIFLLLSVGSGLNLVPRFPANWMNLHLSAGVAILVLTGIRLVTSRASVTALLSWLRGRSVGTPAQILQGSLLLMTLVTAMIGLIIYQAPKLGKGVTLFGLWPMPTLLRLDHTIHGAIIIGHIAISIMVAIMVAVHIALGLRRGPGSERSRLAHMLWPWREMR